MRPARYPLRAIALLAGAVAAHGCGGARFRHLDGHDLAGDYRFAHIERGRIAVDSCRGGIHAVLELEVDSTALGDVPNVLARLGRALLARTDTAPGVAIEGPFCRYGPALPRRMHPGIVRPAMARERLCDPVYYVRAEYLLRHLPAAGEHLIVRSFDRRIVVTWEAH